MSSSNVVHLDSSLEQRLRNWLKPEDVSEPLLNLVRGALSAHEHAFHFSAASKEAFLAFMSEAWDAGVHQYEVSKGKVEGNFNNDYGIACNFAASAVMSNKSQNLIPKEKTAA